MWGWEVWVGPAITASLAEVVGVPLKLAPEEAAVPLGVHSGRWLEFRFRGLT